MTFHLHNGDRHGILVHYPVCHRRGALGRPKIEGGDGNMRQEPTMAFVFWARGLGPKKEEVNFMSTSCEK